jgi:hypothetical protein
MHHYVFGIIKEPGDMPNVLYKIPYAVL